ncbi:MAG: hypothetical protein IJT34_03025 [Butyrivibrio sp.]|nr:hypothetical protein [Butyrivibrio sp.]
MKKTLIRKTAVLTALFLMGTEAACSAPEEAAPQETAKTVEELVLETAQDDTEKETLRVLLQAAGASETEEETESGKSETVYVNTDATGAVEQILVNNWLKNPTGADTLRDATSLTNITSTSGSETWADNGDGTITWRTQGVDVHYQGRTEAALPVELKISYELDGQPVTPEDLAGKSGRVKIRFDYVNHQKTRMPVGDTREEIYTPFTMITGVILDAERFAGVSVSSGRIMADADSYVIIGYACPGMNDSLQLTDEELEDLDMDRAEADLPDHIEITATTAGFEMPMAITYASADLLNDLDISRLTDRLDEMEADMDELADGSGELVDGTKELNDGVVELYDGTKELDDGVKELSDGAKELADGARELADGARELTDGVGQLANGAQALAGGAGRLAGGTQELYEGSGDLKDGLKQLYQGTGQLAKGVGAYADGAVQLAEGATELGAGAEQLAGGFGGLAAGASQFSGGITQAHTGAAQLVAGYEGTEEQPGVTAAAEALRDGAVQVSGGVSALAEGIRSQASQYGALADALEQKYARLLQADAAAIIDRQGTMARTLAAQLQGTVVTAEGRLAAAQSDAGRVSIEPEFIETFEEGTDPGMLAEELPEDMVIGDKDLKHHETASTDDEVTEEVTEDIADEITEDVTVGGRFTPYAATDSATFARLAGMTGQEWDQLMGSYDAYEAACAAYSASGNPSDLVTAMGAAPAAATAVTTVQSLDGMLRQTAASADAMYRGEGSTAGVKALEEGAAQLAEGAGGLTEGIRQLAEGTKQLDSGLAQMAEASPQMAAGVEQLTPGVQSFQEGSASFSEGARQLAENAPELKQGAKELKKGTGALVDGSESLVDGIGQLNSGAQELADGTAAFSDGTYKLQDGARELSDGAVELADGAQELADGTVELSDGTTELRDGVKELLDGTKELADGMQEFDEEGIQKLTDTFGGDMRRRSDRLQAISDAGAAYKTFSGALAGEESSVRFIFKTAAIEAEDD